MSDAVSRSASAALTAPPWKAVHRLAAGTLVTLTSLPSWVHAAPPSANLTYERGAGAAACPDERALRGAVAARLGYDPFFSSSKAQALVSVYGEGNGFRARVRMVGEDGRPRGTRELLEAAPRCAELIDAVALTLSIAISPTAERPAAESALASEANGSPSTSERGHPAAVAREESTEDVRGGRDADRGVRVDMTLGAVGWVGAAPAPNHGATFGLRAAGERLALSLVGRLDAPASEELAGGGDLSTSLVGVTLVPCYRVPVGPLRAGLCVEVFGGALRARSRGVTMPRSDSEPFGTVGPRGSAEVPLAPWLSGVAHVSLAVPMDTKTIQLSSVSVWETGIAAGAGISLLARLF